MIIKAKGWLAYDKKEKFTLLFGMRMYSLGANIRRTLKKATLQSDLKNCDPKHYTTEGALIKWRKSQLIFR